MLHHRHGTQTGSDSYRYAFQGQEKDDEIKGEGNSYNYTYRMHDPRIGRFFAIDPLAPEYPHNSPYAFSENMVIHCVELEELESDPVNPSTKIDAGKWTGMSSVVDENPLRRLDFVTTTDVERTFNLENGTFKTTTVTQTNLLISDKVTGEFKIEFGTRYLIETTQSYSEITGEEYNPYQVILNGYRASDEYNNASSPQERFQRWNTEQRLETLARGYGSGSSWGFNDGNLDESVIAFLPWYQVGRGIQEIQAGNNMGWLILGLELIPTAEIFGTAVNYSLKFTLRAAQISKISFEGWRGVKIGSREFTFGYKYATGVGFSYRRTMNGVTVANDFHTVNGVFLHHYHMYQPGIISSKHIHPWLLKSQGFGYSDLKLGFPSKGFKKTPLYRAVENSSF